MMFKKFIMATFVLTVISAFYSVTSALPLIGTVDRPGGAPLPTQAGGWINGNIMYSDRDYTWASVSPEIQGTEYIRTYNSDKGNTSITYTVEFPIGATVLLACDDRFTSQQTYIDTVVGDFAAPGEFTDTGWNCVTSEGTPQTLSVYSAVIQPGTYVFHHPGITGNNFYVIGALPLPAPIRKAYNPEPQDGSRTPPSGEEGDGFLMLMTFTAGHGATTHTAYFSSNFDDVNDRSAAVCLGSPPYPEEYPTGYYVGLNDSAIPEFARTPLQRGVTYYWVVDESNDTSTYPGDVWSFTIASQTAWDPTPANGDFPVLYKPTVTLAWQMGDVDNTSNAVTYNVYCGTDEAAVAAISTGNTTAPEYKGNVSAKTISFGGLNPDTEYFWRIDTKLVPKSPPFTPTIIPGDIWSFTTAPDDVGGILREWWIGMGGTAVSDLTNDPNYPSNPTGSEIVSSFEGPTNWQDDAHPYGSRLHGWLYISRTGDYTFWIASDDNSQLWLSTDANPANASLISWVSAWTDSRQWDDADVTPSGPIHLEAGNMYYIMGLMKEQGGGDNISAAWRGPDSGGVREVIPGNHLKPYVPVTAENPYPANGASDVPINVTLRWDAGIDGSTGSHYTTQRVYVGSDPVAVAIATTASPEYKSTVSGPNEYGPLSLGYYDEIYWRIDGVVASTGEVQYPGFVWTFRTVVNPAWASNPNPADGATGVDGRATLTWTPGDGATAHTIYLGADDPANMVKVAGPQGPNNYNPATDFELDTTYYWFVVESPGGEWGRTWKFTTSNYIVVDDMESYVPWTQSGNHIFEKWRDGFGDCTPGNGNNTGSMLTENPTPVNGGIQSMKYDYDNDGTVYSPCSMGQESGHQMYSRIEAQVAGLPSGIGTNWTIQGVKALSLRFYGGALNGVEPMWVQLKGGSGYGSKVTYGDYQDEDPNAVTEESWHEWFIDMADLGIDLSNVVSIVIGFGNENGTGNHGFGTVYFDDFRLYTPRCMPSRHNEEMAKFDYAPVGAPDCIVDYKELDIMAEDWLKYDSVIGGIAPGDANLVVRYEFSGNFNDSSTNAIHGTPNGGVSTSYDAGLASDVAVFNGTDGYVDLGNSPKLDFSTGDWTITAWIKPITTTGQRMIYCKGGDAGGGIRYMLTLAETNDHRMAVTTDDNVSKYQRNGDILVNDGEWHHVVGMRDATVLRVYVDGLDDGSTTIPAAYNLSGTSQANAYIGANWNFETSVVQKFFHGSIDDVRVYSKALSQSETVSVMGLTMLHIPVGSPAEIYEGEALGSRVVNFKDYAELMDSWLVEMEYPR